jgi:hypothetical protein
LGAGALIALQHPVDHPIRDAMSESLVSRTRRSVAPGLLIGASSAVAAAFALWVRHRARRAERDHPPIGRFVEVDGVRLHHVERGEGSPVVLLHGNAVLLQDFIASGLVRRLAERHRVIVFDRPGYGFSVGAGAKLTH